MATPHQNMNGPTEKAAARLTNTISLIRSWGKNIQEQLVKTAASAFQLCKNDDFLMEARFRH